METDNHIYSRDGTVNEPVVTGLDIVFHQSSQGRVIRKQPESSIEMQLVSDVIDGRIDHPKFGVSMTEPSRRPNAKGRGEPLIAPTAFFWFSI